MVTSLKRDAQQWIFDRTIGESGKVFHFQGPGRGILPPTVHQHDMISKHLARGGLRLLGIARAELARGHRATALELFFEASNVFGNAQHTVFETNDEKRTLHALSVQAFDEVRALSTSPIEHVEIPCPGGSVFANFHLAAGDGALPCVIFVPGCDMTKEMYPNPSSNPAGDRGMHIISIDGPGQGENNIAGFKLTADNTASAISAVIDYLEARPEVDSDRIAIFGLSFGNQWAVQAACRDHRIAACAAAWASFCDKQYLFDFESPRYKQLMAYLTGAATEDEIDDIAAAMSVDDEVGSIECPLFVSVGEYDPRTPLDELYRLYDAMHCPRELWVHEDQHHITTPTGRVVASERGMWNIDTYAWVFDWLKDRLDGQPLAHSGEVSWISNTGSGPNGTGAQAARSWLEPYRVASLLKKATDA